MKVEDHRFTGICLIARGDVQQVGTPQSARVDRLDDATTWWRGRRLPAPCTSDWCRDNRCFWQRCPGRRCRRGRTTRGEQSAKCNNDPPHLRRVSSSTVPFFSTESKPRANSREIGDGREGF